MKKIFILLFFISISTFSQNEDDVLYSELLRTYKKLGPQTPQIKDFYLKSLDTIILKTSDSILKKDCIAYQKQLKEFKFDNFKKADLDKLTKEDLKDFILSKDDFNDVVTIRHKKYMGAMFLEPIIKIMDGECFIQLRTEYKSDSWIFFDSVTVLAKTEKFTYRPDNVDRDITASSYIKEVDYKVCDNNMLKMLQAIGKCDDYSLVKYRFSGMKGYDDITANYKHVRAIRSTIELYNKLVGNM